LQIISPDGLIYKFGNNNIDLSTWEPTCGSFIPPRFSTHTSAWHLYEIESPQTGEKVTFEYTPVVTSYFAGISETKRLSWAGDPTYCAVTSSTVQPCDNLFTINTVVLNKITYSDGYIEFVAANEVRQDLIEGPAPLSQIKINDVNDHLVRKYELTYNYVESTVNTPCSATGQLMASYYETHKKRLFLTTVTPYDILNNAHNGYEITYDRAELLPPTCSRAQDENGYYNGKDANTTLVEGDRTPSEYEHSIYGMIKTLRYPTGGQTVFTFEPHQVYDDNRTELVEDAVQLRLRYNIPGGLNTGQVIMQEFPYDHRPIAISVLLKKEKLPGANQIHNPDASIRVYIEAPDGSILTGTRVNQTAFTIDYLQGHLGEITAEESFWSPYYTSGTYKAYIVLELPDANEFYEGRLDISYEKSVPAANVNYGGVRLAKMEDFTDSQAVNTKLYSYNKNGESTAAISYRPKYRFSQQVANAEPFNGATGINCAYIICTHELIGSNSVIPRGIGSGNPITYTEVTESTIGNGKIIHYFNYVADQYLSLEAPYPPPISFGYLRGLPIKKEYYKESGELLAKEETHYSHAYGGTAPDTGYDLFKGLSISRISNAPCSPHDEAEFMRQYDFEEYWLVSDWLRTDQQVNTQYDEFGNAVTTTTSFEYNSPYHRQPTKQCVNNSKGETICTEYRYATDFATCLQTLATCKSDRREAYENCGTQYTNCVVDAPNYCENNANCLVPDPDCTSDPSLCPNILVPCEGCIPDREATCETNHNNCLASLPDCEAQYDACQLNYLVNADEALIALNKLAEQNQLSSVVEQTVYKYDEQHNKTLLSSQLRLYKGFTHQLNVMSYLPWKSMQLDRDEVNSFLEANVTTSGSNHQFNFDDAYELIAQIDYDENGNLMNYHRPNGVGQTIIWDAQGLRPIAHISNANENQVWYTSFEEEANANPEAWSGTQSKLNPIIQADNLMAGQYILSYWEKVSTEWEFKSSHITVSTNGFSTQLSGIIDEVRILPISGAQMNTISYDRIGRIITRCDLNGSAIHYTYDDFGRLQAVKDEDGKLIQAYRYEYHHE